MTLAIGIVHAVLAASAVVASLLAVMARTPARIRSRVSVSACIVVLQTIVGDAFYLPYLRSAKPVLLGLKSTGRSVADLFDVKEHLAFVVLATTLGAVLLVREEAKSTNVLRVLLGTAHGGTVLVAALGLACASIRTP